THAFRFHRVTSLTGVIGLLLIAFLSVSGCAKPQFYSFAIFNRTGGEIKEFTLDTRGRSYGFNSPQLNGRQSHPDSPFIGTLPSKVTCRWQDQTGRKHESILSLPPLQKTKGDCANACILILPDQTIKVATFSDMEIRYDDQVQNGLDRIFASN